MKVPAKVPNALTVDVEDYFQVSAFGERVCRSTWDKFECRVENNTDKLLSIFDQCDVRGVMYYLAEALMLDPVYGGNPDMIGWKWLEHQAGFPRPVAGKTYRDFE